MYLDTNDSVFKIRFFKSHVDPNFKTKKEDMKEAMDEIIGKKAVIDMDGDKDCEEAELKAVRIIIK